MKVLFVVWNSMGRGMFQVALDASLLIRVELGSSHLFIVSFEKMFFCGSSCFIQTTVCAELSQMKCTEKIGIKNSNSQWHHNTRQRHRRKRWLTCLTTRNP